MYLYCSYNRIFRNNKFLVINVLENDSFYFFINCLTVYVAKNILFYLLPMAKLLSKVFLI